MGMKQTIPLLLVAAVCGALAGATAGFFTVNIPELQVTPIVVSHPATVIATSTSLTSSPSLSLIPVVNQPSLQLLPVDAFKRGPSSVAVLYRKPSGQALEEKFLGPDRLLGRAVALTSDGWFVTAAQNISNISLTNLVLWNNGQAYTVQAGIADSLDQTVFLKTKAVGLTAAAFANVQGVTRGTAVWTEAQPDEFMPHSVASVSARVSPNDDVSSEFAARRIKLDGITLAGDRGAAVWDPNGSLVGVVDSAVGEPLHLIPSTSIAFSFQSLLSTGGITHAFLGVRAIDLASIRFDGSRNLWPLTGALIRDDKKTGKPGVVHDSPAEKAKLKTGDVIVRVERDILDGTIDLGEVLSEYRPGSQVLVRVLRGTSDIDVPVTLGSIVTSQALK